MSLTTTSAGKQAEMSDQELFLEGVVVSILRRKMPFAKVVTARDHLPTVLERMVSDYAGECQWKRQEVPAQFDLYMILEEESDLDLLVPHPVFPLGLDDTHYSAEPQWRKVDGKIVVQWECNIA